MKKMIVKLDGKTGRHFSSGPFSINKNKEAFDYLVKDATDKPEYVDIMIED